MLTLASTFKFDTIVFKAFVSRAILLFEIGKKEEANDCFNQLMTHALKDGAMSFYNKAILFSFMATKNFNFNHFVESLKYLDDAIDNVTKSIESNQLVEDCQNKQIDFLNLKSKIFHAMKKTEEETKLIHSLIKKIRQYKSEGTTPIFSKYLVIQPRINELFGNEETELQKLNKLLSSSQNSELVVKESKQEEDDSTTTPSIVVSNDILDLTITFLVSPSEELSKLMEEKKKMDFIFLDIKIQEFEIPSNSISLAKKCDLKLDKKFEVVSPKISFPQGSIFQVEFTIYLDEALTNFLAWERFFLINKK